MSNLQELKIFDAINHIERDRYILPSIQREFVWKEPKICSLFDSLMRGFPISTFQFWMLPPERSERLDLYHFLKCFDKYDNQHRCKLVAENFDRSKDLIAVLDGQQRLTALYLGLRGVIYTTPRKTKGGSGLTRGKPKKFYLNLLNEVAEEEEEDSPKYEFKFLSDKQITDARKKNESLWFPVCMVSEGEDGSDQWLKIDEWIIKNIKERKYVNDNERRNAENKAKKIAHKLLNVVRTEAKIFHYDVDEEEIETALQIFVRLNDQGQKLSKTDLLLSIANVHWNRDGPNGEKSAREAVNRLVSELERACPNVKFEKDFVMRTALFVCKSLEVKLNTRYFTRKNMQLLQKNWGKIRECLLQTAVVVSNLQLRGFEKALASHNSLLPIALFFLTYDLSASDLQEEAKDQIQKWLLLSNLKPRVWDGFKHTEVTSMKKHLQKELEDNKRRYKSGKEFPLECLQDFMREKKSPIDFSATDCDELLEKGYSDTETALILDYIMPMREQTHIDHFVPVVALREDFLKEGGLSQKDVDKCITEGDTLVNLQLLPIGVNISKQGKLPLDWITDEKNRNDPNKILVCSAITKLWPSWPDDSEMPGGKSINKIPDFFVARRKLMRKELMQKLVHRDNRQPEEISSNSKIASESD